MIFDTHMHCNNSCDSHMTFAEAIAEADRKNIGITVTEHWDYDYPTNPDAFIFDLNKYFQELQPLCNDKVLIGLEIGMQKHIADEDDKIAAAYPFDYVLASIHCVNRKDIYEKSFYLDKDKDDVVQEFLEDAVLCVQSHDNYDSFAHIDYICRYWPYENKEFVMQQHQQLFDKLFLSLIKKGKPLEINTRRLDQPQAAAALLLLYQRYRYLGGRYCTLGSDAHYKEHVGRRMDIALKIAQNSDLQPVYFKQRKMHLLGERL